MYTTLQIFTSRSESELFMTEEDMLSWVTYVTNIEAFGLMIVPWQPWPVNGKNQLLQKHCKRLLQSLKFTRNILIYFSILANLNINAVCILNVILFCF